MCRYQEPQPSHLCSHHDAVEAEQVSLHEYFWMWRVTLPETVLDDTVHVSAVGGPGLVCEERDETD